ncbi:AMP-binding protein [Xenorhabdus bovienii]|uniref:AMP-binding protein n=1 Tax=Xenorhabdus bovienii TaxID=40576 RepID=UPI0023B2926A|nr:AMP-binding protein [Xenorhabdus bovienii]MDE9535781.1 AMP-binding protein [Xenorhabdus bovienii]MDE9589629.1 AMP-binding protein [Xenorhabdus bovienii]
MCKTSILQQETKGLKSLIDGGDKAVRTSIWQAFVEVVNGSPQNIACCGSDISLTYLQLYSLVINCADSLLLADIEKDSRVGLVLRKDLPLVVYLLACWKLGASVLIIDEDISLEQIKHKAQVANLDIIIGSNILVSNTISFKFVTASKSDELRNILGKQFQFVVDELLNSETDRLAAIMFTSGSTGAPKCVGLYHSGLLNIILGLIHHYKLETGSRIAWAASLSFDTAIAEPLLALLSGATVVIPENREPLIGSLLENFVFLNGITHLVLTPTVLETADPERIPTGITIALVGEPFSPTTLTRWANNRTLYNAYGPSEASICATVTNPLQAGDTVTVGWPLPGVEIEIVDENLELVPNYVVGEVVIGGVGVSYGYLNDPHATAASFISTGSDGKRRYLTGDIGFKDYNGQLTLKGRKDDQVKIDGRRVDLAEVERVLSMFSSIRQVAAAKLENYGKTRLAAYIFSEPRQPRPTVKELWEHARKLLPHYLVPSKWYLVDSMPTTQNGKLDRRKLVSLVSEELEYNRSKPAEDALEERIAAIFSEILQIEQVGRSDDFFALGGTSLDAIRFIERLRTLFETDFKSKDLIDVPTVAGVAAKLHSMSTLLKQTGASLSETEEKISLSHITYPPFIWSERFPEKVFLTGGTGFLGSLILEDLLVRTSAFITCAVRSSDLEAQIKRLTARMRKADTWNSEWQKRIEMVQLDLANPISEIGKAAAAITNADLVIHCGAHINSAYDYNSLRQSNVLSTSKLIELASFGIPKRFIYISSRSAVDSVNMSGYGQSKRAAEKVMSDAFTRGLSGLIIRPGRITGHSERRYANSNDFIVRYLKLCRFLGKYPKGLNVFCGTPVDILSDSVIHAATNSSVSDTRIFEPADSELYVFDEIFSMISSLGVDIQAVDVDEWLHSIQDGSQVDLEKMFPDILVAVRYHWEQMKYSYEFQESKLHMAPASERIKHTSDLALFIVGD